MVDPPERTVLELGVHPYGCQRHTYDGVVGGFVNAARLRAYERRMEHRFRAAEALVADRDHLSTWKLVALFQRRAGSCRGHLLLKVKWHIAQQPQLLLDVTNYRARPSS